MTCATATFPQPGLFDGRLFTFGECRRVIRGSAAIGLGTIAAAGVVGFVTIAAAWMVSASLSGNPSLHPTPMVRPPTMALSYRYPVLAGVPDRPESGQISAAHAVAPNFAFEAEFALASAKSTPVKLVLSTAAALEPAHEVAAAPPRSSPAPNPAPPRITKAAASMADPMPTGTITARPAPAPTAEPPARAHAPPTRSFEPAKRSEPAPGPKLAALPPPASSPEGVPTLRAYTDLHGLPGPHSRIAVYDIAAHTVYLPNGDRLEAHSGVGHRMDDPRYVREKNRGPTPPNVYDLKLRGQLFHGVRAIRLNPIDESGMFGRDGMLAHTYMLGPTGQSFGCVSFKNYPAFLRAYLNGEIDRIVVVPRLPAGAARPAISRQEEHERKATTDRGSV